LLVCSNQSTKTEFTVKVADFGLGTLLGSDQVYSIASKLAIPVK
jgi:hypothetical protein